MDYRVSVLQYEPKLLDKQKNLAMLREMLCELDTDLVVLPELCTTGYLFPSREALVKVSEEYPSGAAFETFSEIASNRQMSIVYGFSELSGDTLYNSCALINPDGSHHLYRKTHLFDREKLFFTLGDTGLNVFTAKGGVKIGMMICFDWQSRMWLPLFQFNRLDMRPQAGLRGVLEALTQRLSPWALAQWFAQPNPWLADQSPCDALGQDPPAVLRAACAEVPPLTH